MLAEKLIKIHPWSKMATFSRTGAEANAIAIRIARIFSQKDEKRFVDIMDGMIGIYRVICLKKF